jgi:hypothetical protein
MRRPATLILVLVLAMAALAGRAIAGPGAQDGATPDASPAAGGVEDLLAKTEGLSGTDQQHRLYRVTLEAGHRSCVRTPAESALFTVEQGGIVLAVGDPGDDCPSASGGEVELDSGQAHALGQGRFVARTLGSESAVFIVAVVATFPGDGVEGCWICPTKG